jgi:hypothetical protein
VLLWSASQRLLCSLPRTGLSPALANLSRLFRWLLFSSKHPQPRGKPRFGLFRFRSPLLTESMSLSVPAGNEMFQFPAFAPHTLCVQVRVTRSLGLGFPIRTSPDQRLFADSPGLIAGCRVLRRLSMPRHSPCTLCNLTTFTDHRQLPPLISAWSMNPASTCRSPAGARDATIHTISNGPSFAKKVPDDSSALTVRPTERQHTLQGRTSGGSRSVHQNPPPSRKSGGTLSDKP